MCLTAKKPKHQTPAMFNKLNKDFKDGPNQKNLKKKNQQLQLYLSKLSHLGLQR